MTVSGLTRFGVTLGVALALAGCESGKPLGFLNKAGGGAEPVAGADAAAGTDAAAAPAVASAGGERDVEAPEVFNLSDKALWDGRPSLGGVWVAHASVKDPQRVIIRNAANGKSVIGALFRREVDNPGPSLQLSSDAAEALGLLAGQPAVVDVVALKRVEAPAPAPAPAPKAAAKPADAAAATAAKTAAKTAPEAKPIVEKKLDPVAATAAAAIEKATTGGKAAKATAAVPAAAAPAPAGALKRPYVQIGIFSLEANAQKAAAQMQKAGMGAAVKADASQGKSFWRVIVGPAATEADRAALAAKVKALGYPDAYPVSK